VTAISGLGRVQAQLLRRQSNTPPAMPASSSLRPCRAQRVTTAPCHPPPLLDVKDDRSWRWPTRSRSGQVPTSPRRTRRRARDLEGTAFAFVLDGFTSLQAASPADAQELLDVSVSQAWWRGNTVLILSWRGESNPQPPDYKAREAGPSQVSEPVLVLTRAWRVRAVTSSVDACSPVCDIAGDRTEP